MASALTVPMTALEGWTSGKSSRARPRVASTSGAVRAPRTKEAIPNLDRPTFAVQTHDIYEELMRRAAQIPAIACMVAYPCDESSLRGAVEQYDWSMMAGVYDARMEELVRYSHPPQNSH